MAVDGVAGADPDVHVILFIGGLLRTSLDEKPKTLLAALHPRTLQSLNVSSQLLHRPGGINRQIESIHSNRFHLPCLNLVSSDAISEAVQLVLPTS